ncbi:uracil-DNA glycosylase [Crocinitomix catalasitica]|nr:uracil-DNA glycosylase [Crocinitomix catalasitica]
MEQIDSFIANLQRQKSSQKFFNPYFGHSKEAQIMRSNLRIYLNWIKEWNPNILMLGEAPGYRGCSLTGVPFSSEHLLDTHPLFEKVDFEFVNRKHLQKETSAQIVWEGLEGTNNLPLIWNSFPFHPHEKNNVKSNRTPIAAELELGQKYIMELIRIFKIKQIIAVGRKAEFQCKLMNLDCRYVRHPARGGKYKFLRGIKKELSQMNARA